MIELKGKHNTTKVFTDVIDEKSTKQIIDLLNSENFKNSKIRIMPDVHAGAGCVIGLSMTITDKVIPNFVGVDIGCGVLTVKLEEKDIDFEKLDKIIHENIPAGFDVRKRQHGNVKFIDFKGIKTPLNDRMKQRARVSVGTLGGGNHFISIEQDSDGNNYLLIHTGSRNFGLQIADYYQKTAKQFLKSKNGKIELGASNLIERLKEENRQEDIEEELKKYYEKNSYAPTQVDKDLAHLETVWMDAYLHDMEIAQNYASWNRRTIAEIILEKMDWCKPNDFEKLEYFDTIHNYIDIESMILRKGSVSAKKNEKLIIPINMRDGSIIAVGKGNEDWNYTAPHGAGRLYGRSEAKRIFNIEDYKETMKDIYSTSVSQSTLDECPMAYKSIDDIVDNIKDTADILDVLKPVYNFKA